MKANVTIVIETLDNPDHTILKRVVDGEVEFTENQHAVQAVETGEACATGEHDFTLKVAWKNEAQVKRYREFTTLYHVRSISTVAETRKRSPGGVVIPKKLPIHVIHLIQRLVEQYEGKHLKGYDHLIHQEVHGLLARDLLPGERDQIRDSIHKSRHEFYEIRKSV